MVDHSVVENGWKWNEELQPVFVQPQRSPGKNLKKPRERENATGKRERERQRTRESPEKFHKKPRHEKKAPLHLKKKHPTPTPAKCGQTGRETHPLRRGRWREAPTACEPPAPRWDEKCTTNLPHSAENALLKRYEIEGNWGDLPRNGHWVEGAFPLEEAGWWWHFGGYFWGDLSQMREPAQEIFKR